ncbi:unnamed protein product [Polarella glacialis]|uniref:Protein kinase domain-containing protein n=1 Tax=Polarella glacialis TaxID=89957 RepID=A0A813GKE1_POLGL|nr:unnamed protein product [Polarella glacialis]
MTADHCMPDGKVTRKTLGEIRRGGHFGERSLLRGGPNFIPEVNVRASDEGMTCLAFEGHGIRFLLEELFKDAAVEGANVSSSVEEYEQEKFSRSRRRAHTTKHAEVIWSKLQQVCLLGKGGFAEVFLVENRQTKQRYALKRLSKGHIERNHAVRQVCWERELLLLVESPFVIRLFRTFKDDQFVYLLMEAALGGSLYEALQTNPEVFCDDQPHGSASAFYVACILAAIEHLHDRRIVYRDLKPENVLLNEPGYARLCDMGFARFVLGKTNTLAGTPEYMAPEVIDFPHAHDMSADWWSLGVLTFELMAGQAPWEDDGISDPHGKLLAIRRSQEKEPRYPFSCPALVRNFISRLMTKLPRRLGVKDGAKELRVRFRYVGVGMGLRNICNYRVLRLRALVSNAPDVVEVSLTTIQESKSEAPLGHQLGPSDHRLWQKVRRLGNDEMDPSQTELDQWRASPTTALQSAIAWCGMSANTLDTIKMVLGDFQLVHEVVLMPSGASARALTLAVVRGSQEVVNPDGTVASAAIAARYLNALELGQVGSLTRCCRLLMEPPAEEAQAGPITQASNNQGTSQPAASRSPPVASSPSRRVKMSTCIDQADDTEVYAMNSSEARTIIETFTVQNDGIALDSDEECDATQLQALKTKLDMDIVPYADFAVWRPYGIRMARMMKFRAQAWRPESAQFITTEMAGPPNHDEWKRSWKVYSFGMRALGAASHTRLTKYAESIDDLVSKYSSRPEEVGVCSQTGIKYDKLKPWDAVFLYASQDRNFWDSEVKEKALLYATKIKDMPDLTDEGHHAAGDEGETRGKKRQRTKKGQEVKTPQRVKKGKGGKGDAGKNWQNEWTPAPKPADKGGKGGKGKLKGNPNQSCWVWNRDVNGCQEAKEERASELSRPQCVKAKRERYLRTKLPQRGPDKRRRGNKDVARVALKLLQTGKPWDLKIGGAARDVLTKEGLPRWKQLPRVRSKNFPLGLPNLTAHDKEKVETSNVISRHTASWRKALHRAGLAFIIENPGNSYLWMLEDYLELAKLPGVRDVDSHNCMHGDGSVTFKTEGEAEYPQGMCDAIAEVVKAHLGTLSEEEKAGLEYSFSEIFAGRDEMEDTPTAATGNGEPCAAEESSRIPGAAGDYEAKIWTVLKTKTSKGIDEGTDMNLERTGVCNNSIVRKPPGPDRPGKVVLRTNEESNRDRRARENRECLGGMRSPWRTVGKLPNLRKVGKRCRKVVEDYLAKHPEALAIMRGLGSTPDEEGKARIAEVVGEIRNNLKSELRAGNEVSTTAPEIVMKFEPAANYKSVEEQRELAGEEIDRAITKGYASWRATWKELLEEFGEVVVSMMACIIKERPDGTLKVRLVADLRRSGCNEFVSASERIVLPRPSEAVEDITALGEALEDGEEVWLGVADFVDAVHTWALRPSERKFAVVRHPKAGYVVYDTVLFGGTEREATRKMLTLLLFWAAFGPDIAWNKASFGRSATWIGAKFDVLDGENFSVEIPEKYAREMREEAEDLNNRKAADINRMQKFVGKGSWASGLVPILGTMLSPLWAAMKDANNSRRQRRTDPGCQDSSRFSLAAGVLSGGEPREVSEETVLCQPSPVERQSVHHVDASPWGFGAWLAIDGAPTTWLAGAWTDEDAARLGARIGNGESQNAWEALGILICFRTWLCAVAKERVRLRSDSVNALVAIAKERSKSQTVNLIAREIALNLAEINYVVDLETVHLPAVFNDWADALSRMCEDDRKYTVPRPRP